MFENISLLFIIGGFCGVLILLCVSLICAIVFGVLCNKKAKESQVMREKLKNLNEQREKSKQQLNAEKCNTEEKDEKDIVTVSCVMHVALCMWR